MEEPDPDEVLPDEDDVDFVALSNLLKSYSLQPTEEGPLNSIMTSMGVRLPPMGNSEGVD